MMSSSQRSCRGTAMMHPPQIRPEINTLLAARRLPIRRPNICLSPAGRYAVSWPPGMNSDGRAKLKAKARRQGRNIDALPNLDRRGGAGGRDDIGNVRRGGARREQISGLERAMEAAARAR